MAHVADEDSEEAFMDTTGDSEETMNMMDIDKLPVYSGLAEAQPQSIYTQNLLNQLTGVEPWVIINRRIILELCAGRNKEKVD